MSSMQRLLTIAEVRRAALAGRVEARLHAQVEAVGKKETRDGKPYWEVALADAEARLALRAWSDSPNFNQCAELRGGAFLEVEGEFAHHPAFGVEAKRWACKALGDAERDALLGGPPELRARQEADWQAVCAMAESMGDPRLRALSLAFLAEYGERFRRTAAARSYHHARRGGLVEHTAQMMRSAGAVADVYPRLNRDLMVAGALFHDIGKLWENALPEQGFTMAYSEPGEMLGHITIGVEIVNGLWRKLLAADEAAAWAGLQPASEDVRMHLLHLIVSHHGTREFGSPVEPKTPEAHALHHIDNLDAKLEMVFMGYAGSPLLGPRIYERARPLPGNLIEPLPAVQS